MTTIVPEGEAIRKAVKWISGEMEDRPGRTRKDLINEAVVRFDLSPRDAEFLTDFYRKANQGSTPH